MRRAKRLVTKLFLVCLIALLANGQPLTFDAGNVGGPRSDARAELFMPQGAGPFPAVVVLHGCDGVGRHYRMLILIGEADDWTPVDRRIRWRDRAEANGHALHLKTYPGRCMDSRHQRCLTPTPAITSGATPRPLPTRSS